MADTNDFSEGPGNRADEHRAASRYRFDLPASDDSLIRVTELLGPVSIRDVSRTGIGLIVRHPVAVERKLTVWLYNRTKGAWFKRSVRVTHGAAGDDGSHIVVGVFQTELTPQELESVQA